MTLEGYRSELTALRDQLKSGLSDTAHEPSTTEGPSVSELAERIKALKAANSIDGTPQRVRQNHSTAEEPITARIRRRTETDHTSDQPVDADASSTLAFLGPESTTLAVAANKTLRGASSCNNSTTRNGDVKPDVTFHERLEVERRGMQPKPSLS